MNFQDESSGIETEVCCCKGDNCFLPDWFDVKHHQEGQSGKAQQRQDNSGWQRTLLICIGVALAFLAVCKYLQSLHNASFHLGLHCLPKYAFTWLKVFRIIPEFRILRLTFCGKSVSKS